MKLSLKRIGEPLRVPIPSQKDPCHRLALPTAMTTHLQSLQLLLLLANFLCQLLLLLFLCLQILSECPQRDLLLLFRSLTPVDRSAKGAMAKQGSRWGRILSPQPTHTVSQSTTSEFPSAQNTHCRTYLYSYFPGTYYVQQDRCKDVSADLKKRSELFIQREVGEHGGRMEIPTISL